MTDGDWEVGRPYVHGRDDRSLRLRWESTEANLRGTLVPHLVGTTRFRVGSRHSAVEPHGALGRLAGANDGSQARPIHAILPYYSQRKEHIARWPRQRPERSPAAVT
jgi:hypothetical protein